MTADFQVIDGLLGEFRKAGFSEAVGHGTGGIIGTPHSKDVVLERVIQDASYLHSLALIYGDIPDQENPRASVTDEVEDYLQGVASSNISNLTEDEFRNIDQRERAFSRGWQRGVERGLAAMYLESYAKATNERPTPELFKGNADLAVLGLQGLPHHQALLQMLKTYLGFLEKMPANYINP